MTMITPSYLGETIEYSSLHACRSTLEDPTRKQPRNTGWDGFGAQQGWLTDLVALRQSQGLEVKMVNVQDIYDEFSYGIPTPVAIRDFLSYAYTNWSSPAPQYVLLVGDSTYDYKDNYNRGTVNYVPAYTVYTDYMGETVTDENFVTISGDDAVADMYIGRLPANSAAEAQAMAAKIIAYETDLNTGSWEKNVVLVADNPTEAYEAVFETITNRQLRFCRQRWWPKRRI